jgi:hypothetical protein
LHEALGLIGTVRNNARKNQLCRALEKLGFLKPGRAEGVRKIAKRFGVDPSTVQRISRPLDGVSATA